MGDTDDGGYTDVDSNGKNAGNHGNHKCEIDLRRLYLRPGDSGVLPLISTGLRRNDVEVG